jgi:hypothetical protein
MGHRTRLAPATADGRLLRTLDRFLP